MKLVPENIDEALDFERGQDPKKAMDIGQTMLDRKFIEETPWTVSIMDSMEIVELHKNFYKGYPALIMIDHGAIMKTSPRYFANSILGINSKYRGSPKLALENFKDIIKWKIIKKNTFESQEFTREGDPLKKMSVGQTAIDQHIIDTTLWALRKEMWEDTQGRPYEFHKLIRNYRGFPILLLKDVNIDPKEESNMSAIWIATSTMSYTNWSSSEIYAIGRMKEIIDSLLKKGDASVQNSIDQFKIKHGEPVTEKLDFERGGEPIKTMDIGQTYLDRKFIEDTNWFITFSYDDYDIIDLIKDYQGYPLLILKNKFRSQSQIQAPAWTGKAYVGTSTDETGIGGRGAATPEIAEQKVKEDLDEWLSSGGNANEAQNFTRKGDPLNKMGIGREVRLKQLNSEIKWDWDAKRYKDAVQEEVLDIVPHGKYFVKLSRMWYIDGSDVSKKYFVTSNVEQDYPQNGPNLHDSPDGLIDGEKKWMDEWVDSIV